MARLLFAPTSVLGLAAVLALSGCNALNSSADHTIAAQLTAPPAAIVVQTFALSPDAPPPGGAGAVGSERPAPSDAERAARGFSESLAAHLVADIRTMGLPALLPDAALPPAGNVVTLEGRFVSVPAADSADPAVVRLADAWPDVVVEVEIYDTTETRDRLVEDMEFRISETNELVPAGALAGLTAPAPASNAAGTPISPAIQAKLDAAARDGAAAIAKRLEPFFADQGWIAHPPGS